MNEVQQVLIRLLEDIDSICRKQRLTYMLGQETALCAARWGRFADDCHTATVFMPADSYDAFEQYCNNSNIPNRVAESLATNECFPHVHLKFVDVSTTFVDAVELPHVRCRGISVAVCKLAPFLPTRKSRSRLNIAKGFAAVRWGRVFGGAAGGRKRKLLGRVCEMLFGAKRLYRMNLMPGHLPCSNDDGMRVWVQRYRRRALTFDAHVFDELSFAILEGRKFPIPADIDAFMAPQYGRRWMTRTVSFSPCSFGTFVDVETPYREYEEILASMDLNARRLQGLRRRRARIASKRLALRTELNRRSWYFERTEDRMRLASELLPQKQELLALYRAADFSDLYIRLFSCQIVFEKHTRRGVPFAFDKDFYYLICDVLNWQGCVRTRRKLLAMKDEAFAYLDHVQPENESELDGSPFRFVLETRQFELRADGAVVAFAASAEELHNLNRWIAGEFPEDEMDEEEGSEETRVEKRIADE